MESHSTALLRQFVSRLARGWDALQATPPPPQHVTSIKEQKAKQKTSQQVMQWNLGLHNMIGFRETSVTWAQHLAFRDWREESQWRGGLLHHFIKPHSNCKCCVMSSLWYMWAYSTDPRKIPLPTPAVLFLFCLQRLPPPFCFVSPSWSEFG